MIQIHPDIIDQLEAWVRSDPRHSMQLESCNRRDVWRLLLQITTMPRGESIIHEWRMIMVGDPGTDLATEVQAAIDQLAARLPERAQLPHSEQQFDWLYAWPSHRIERSHRLMIHMLEHNKPWTGRYLSD